MAGPGALDEARPRAPHRELFAETVRAQVTGPQNVAELRAAQRRRPVTADQLRQIGQRLLAASDHVECGGLDVDRWIQRLPDLSQPLPLRVRVEVIAERTAR